MALIESALVTLLRSSSTWAWSVSLFFSYFVHLRIEFGVAQSAAAEQSNHATALRGLLRQQSV